VKQEYWKKQGFEWIEGLDSANVISTTSLGGFIEALQTLKDEFEQEGYTNIQIDFPDEWNDNYDTMFYGKKSDAK